MVNAGRFIIILTILLSALSARGQDEITSTIEDMILLINSLN